MRKLSTAVSSNTYYLILICAVAIILSRLFIIYIDYKDAQAEIQQKTIGPIKERLARDTRHTVELIYGVIDEANAHTNKVLVDHTNRAYSIIENLYLKYHEILPEDQLKHIIADAISPIRYNEGRGYFFITALDGTVILQPARPDLTGTNAMEVEDAGGQQIVKTLVDIARSHGMGLLSYLWQKPESDGPPTKKIAYVRLFKPLNWTIGTGEYVENINNDIQERVLRQLSNYRAQGDEYLFAGTYDGLSLIGPAKGKNVYEAEDANGMKVVQHLISTVKKGGGFLEYDLPNIDPLFPAQKKLSYALPIPEWQWYVGIGANMDTAEILLQENRARITQQAVVDTVIIVFFFCAIIILSYFYIRKVQEKLEKSFKIFNTFFKKSTDSLQPIRESELQYAEFKQMAKQANTMIKHRLETEKALIKSETTYREIFNSTSDAIFISDVNTKQFIDVNQAFLEMYGYTRQEAFNLVPADISYGEPPYSAKEADDILERAADGEIVSFEWQDRRKDGTFFWTDNTARGAVIDGQKRIVVVSRDITERKRIQEIMIQTEKMMSVGGLAAGMAHEINNPLGIIMQTTQNIVRRLSPDFKKNNSVALEHGIDLQRLRQYLGERSITTYLTTIQEAGERAATIVRNMLNFSRKTESLRTSCDLKNIINNALDIAANDYDLKKKYDFKRVVINKDFAELPEVMCTETEIGQVVLNIIKNAAHAMSTKDYPEQEHPQLNISTKDLGSYIRLTIQDNGPGIDEVTRKSIFEPFYTTKEPGEGTGLGLSVSYFIVTTHHHGRISVESQLGVSTTFIIDLPKNQSKQ
ncbi:MAG: cache domain-containing protein [Desulfovibrio sp.]